MWLAPYIGVMGADVASTCTKVGQLEGRINFTYDFD